MSRLIDADEFKKYAHKNLDICSGDLICMIDDQPTAYDIDAVVHQLEDFLEEMKRFGCDGILTDIIDVVKRGGE